MSNTVLGFSVNSRMEGYSVSLSAVLPRNSQVFDLPAVKLLPGLCFSVKPGAVSLFSVVRDALAQALVITVTGLKRSVVRRVDALIRTPFRQYRERCKAGNFSLAAWLFRL